MLPLIGKFFQRATPKNQSRGIVSSSRSAVHSSPSPVPSPSQASPFLQKTTLQGGVQVISVDMASPVTTLDLYVNAGSRYENRQTLHSSLFLKHLAFKGTNEKSAIRLLRDIEHIGGSYSTSLTRDHLSYHLSALRNFSSGSVSLDILTETLRFVLNPLLLEHEVETTRKIVEREVSEARGNYPLRISDLIHSEAFRDSGLANPLAPSDWRTSEITPQEIYTFVKNNFYPGERITVVGTGIEHSLLIEKLKPLFSDPSLQGKFRELRRLPKLVEEAPVPQNPEFVGSGIAIRITESTETNLGLGFPGVSKKSKELYSMLVLTEVLGSFSPSVDISYGLDTILSSKLGEVGEKNPWINSLKVENFSYSDTGVLVIYAQAQDGHGKELASVLSSTLKKVADSTSNEEIEAAKLRVKNNYLRKVSRCRGAFSNVLVNCGITSSEFLGLVEGVSVGDVKNLAGKVFGVSPVVAAIGDVRGIPRLG